MTDEPFEDVYEWIAYGVNRGWVTPPFCQTHDGWVTYMTEEESEEFDDGGDPCIHITRLFPPAEIS